MQTSFKRTLLGSLVLLCLVLPSCFRSQPTQVQPSATEKSGEGGTAVTETGEPAEVTVQHCLIAFNGSLPGTPIRRSQEEAQQLANDLLKLVQSGDNFDEIVRQFTDDSAPGIYSMSNFGVPGDAFRGVTSRDGMVASFGDVAFKLQVGEYGLAVYDPEKSKYGWHIIKRIK